jgi:hypothetical protein
MGKLLESRKDLPGTDIYEYSQMLHSMSKLLEGRKDLPGTGIYKRISGAPLYR